MRSDSRREKDFKEGRQTVFFTAVDPVSEPQENELCDVTEPREVPCRTKWEVYQNAVSWISFKKQSGERISILATAIQHCYPS